MGVDVRKPPLPAPTESMDETSGLETSGLETELATNITTRTDKTSHTIPEDGSPITISTQKLTGSKEGGRPGHRRQKSHTSLLIEYFEGGKSGDKVKTRPSVRVKVTPSAAKKGRNGVHDAVQITGIGKDRKPSYTRRISLGSSKNVETGLAPTELTGTEVSQSSESNLSGHPPVEIEVLNANGSDMSSRSRGLIYAPNESNVSSMPPDSMVDGSDITRSERSRALHDHDEDEDTVTAADHLKAPVRSRSRSASRDRITQKVMAKLGQTAGKPRKSSGSHHERSIGQEYDADGYPRERRRRSSKSHYVDDDNTVSGAESSLLSSQLAPSQRSYRSGTSQGSRMTNNPKLLEMVEDTIKRMILPEINAIKEDQKTDRNMRSFEGGRTSLPRDDHELDGVERRVSKSSSSPNIASKPKVVLNRDGDDPGTVLSRGDSERRNVRKSSRESQREHRPSSRQSSGQYSRRDDRYEDGERMRHSSSKSGHGLRDAAAAGMAGGVLTAAALQHHDSQGDGHSRRQKRSKSRASRSRSNSIAETTDEAYARKEDIPPLPMTSHINDSDITRDSIVSAATERPHSRSADVQTPVREVSRGTIQEAMSPVSSRTPTGTPVSHGLGMSHTNHSIGSSIGGISSKARMAALAASGLGGAAVANSVEDHHEHADGYGDVHSHHSVGSPVQSVSSLKKQFEEEDSLVPHGLRPKSAASRSSAGRLRERESSRSSLHSPRSSPTTARLAHSRKQSQNISGDEFVTPMEQPNMAFMGEGTGTPGTPNGGESIDDWYERQHQLNDRYRDSIGETTNRDSIQTNPFPEDDKRFTTYTDDSLEGNSKLDEEHNVRPLAAQPQFHHSPHEVESAVASLMDPSTLSSNLRSSDGSSLAAKQNGSYANRMAEHLREMGKDSPAVYEGSTLSETMPSQDRWAALRGHARSMSASTNQDHGKSVGSPQQSPARSLRGERSVEQPPVMGASGLPLADDPLPEIGHFDDSRSDVLTNPSIIHGPLGGDATGKDTWPYSPEPRIDGQRELSARDSRSPRSGFSREDGMLGAAAGGAAALAAAHATKPHMVEDSHDVEDRLTPDARRGEDIDREATPTSPAAFRDEGYVTDAHARSTGAITPRAEQRRYDKNDVEEYERAMDAQHFGPDDPFTGDVKHARHVSGNSHGLASPLYDSATGKGLDNIQSKDIVALMDHLTVRDAQRNARDTEILVTLVRSAAEMRQSFHEMRRFIAEQDKIIMQNTDRDAEQTVQKVLGGPRPQPLASPRTPRRESQEEIQTKRKNVLRRALKGLTGGKKADDLAKIEDMLMQILDNVEDLKYGGVARQPMQSYTTDTLDSYEKLRAPPDSGYEPEGQAGTSSTPSHSGNLSVTPRGEKQQFHSGYDGRRGSMNRVSTVAEGDEDEDLTPDEERLMGRQFENNERMLTPTQELQRKRGVPSSNTPPRQAATYNGAPTNDLTPKAAEKQRKHKSNGSSTFGVPKVSRWSKTTTSSGAPDSALLDSPNASRNVRPSSVASRSESQSDKYGDEEYSLRDEDRLRQTETRSMRSQASRLNRTPSPLIPSETSARYENEYERSPVQEDLDDNDDDPKYQAHRNSLNLQHPQPRQGTTGRHQNTLESQAHTYYDDQSGTNSDLSQRTVSDSDPLMFGSAGTAALARNRLSLANPTTTSGLRTSTTKDDGPLVPQKPKPAAPPPKIHEPEPEPDWEPQYSNSGFSRGGYSYNSPYGSGHLLEPIEEVRYSLETDSGRVSFPPSYTPTQASPRSE